MPPKTSKAETHAKNEAKRTMTKKEKATLKEKDADLKRAAALALRAGSSKGGALLASLKK